MRLDAARAIALLKSECLCTDAQDSVTLYMSTIIPLVLDAVVYRTHLIFSMFRVGICEKKSRQLKTKLAEIMLFQIFE